jgi:hypothetical protein
MGVAVLDVAVRLLIIIVKHKRSQCLALRRNAPSDQRPLQRVPIVARRWADLVLSVRWEAVARGNKHFPYPDYLTSSCKHRVTADTLYRKIRSNC